MHKNVGGFDRWARLAVGIVLLAVLFTVEGPWRWIGLLGFVLVGTALVRWCPLYVPLGMDTCGCCKAKK